MSRNNQINSKVWTTADITSETISEVWNFWEEAFTDFEGVSFYRDTENSVMYIYLDEDKHIYITVSVGSSGSGILIKYFLNDEECTYTTTTTTGSNYKFGCAYIRTIYGIAWCVKSGTADIVSSYYGFNCVYTLKSTPTLIVGIATPDTTSSTHYILSPLHDSIETMKDSNVYLSSDLGGQKFAVANAYSCAENLKLRHLFRVLGKPNGSYPLGSVEVGTKKLFWFGRYALEYEKDE